MLDSGCHVATGTSSKRLWTLQRIPFVDIFFVLKSINASHESPPDSVFSHCVGQISHHGVLSHNVSRGRTLAGDLELAKIGGLKNAEHEELICKLAKVRSQGVELVEAA